MREIKFRAFAGDRKGMYYNVGFINYDNCFYVIPFDSRGNEMDRMHSHSHKMIMMQYAGLKDKNGKEIYEGDILKSESDFVLSVEYFSGRFNVVGFDRKLSDIHDLHYYIERLSLCEVIGNIYENPELLKSTP